MSKNTDSQAEEFIREITRCQPAVTAFLRSLLPGHSDPRDVLQEVNITLWKKRESYREGSNFKAWAFKIAKYHALNERRKMKKAGMEVFDDDIFNDLAENGERISSNLEDRLAALRLCQERLRDQDKELLRVRYAAGISIEQYAQLHEFNAATVRAKLRNIRNLLRECISFRMKGETQ